ncbi:MAG TPA: phosphate ABC transporter permease subunit PstC [Bacteroidales bacterium]|nr:phosphate ABC transporter permease subunit PstC [Bacteroidales bacterium]HPS72793.1 phosphate ABC transporter permease subunit PstC [Bacteroidales bacterium]
MRLFTRKQRNGFNSIWMIASLTLLALLPLMLFTGLYLKSFLLLHDYNLFDLLFSREWKPGAGKFGFYPFIIGSIWVTLLAMLISAPICLLSAIYVTQYTRKWFIRIMHPAIDILAGIPSVVYGLWGILVIVPFIGNYLGPLVGAKTMGYSILAGSFVLSIMIIPFILNIMIEIFRSIPDALKEASLSLGATQWQTVKTVMMRKALPGIIAALGFGLARAFGETMAVMMVIGNVVMVPHSIYDPGYTLPALIANNYGEMLSIPKYDSALMFAALILLAVSLFFNLLMHFFISRYNKY